MSSAAGPNFTRNSLYDICVFKTSGTFTPNFTGTVEVLVVAGGGGAGMDMGGGGGAGGVLSSTSYSVTAGSQITITVGAGGTGAPAAGTNGQPGGHQYTISATAGSNSTFGSLTAIGGGRGGSSYWGYTPDYGLGGSGGSGGGASGYSNGTSGSGGGAGTSGQGNRGGNVGGQYYSGGGGGAGAAGADGTNQANGGDGIINSILESVYYWGGGGGGAAYSLSTGGNGGKGGGGGGAVGTTVGGEGLNNGSPGGGGTPNSWPNTPGGDGGINTGGGGGGGSHYNANNKGGNGGSGIVIVRYLNSSGSSNVTSGVILRNTNLILFLDAFNRKSNIRATNDLIDKSGWTVGYSQTGGWPSNGDAAQNEILYDTDPWGNSSLVLKTHPNNGGANGGWEGISPGYWISANRTKKYRSTVWVRRVSSNSNGIFYHGLHTDGTGDIIQSDGSTNGNPYWACQNIGYLTQNQWYLHVGHIFPYNSTPSVDSTSGYWTISGGYVANPGCNITGLDPRFPSDASLLRQRVYHYYANDSASNIELYYPRIDCCDGTEPSIQELLNNGPSQWKDLSGNNNHFAMNGTMTFNSSTGFSGFDANHLSNGNKFFRNSFPKNLKTSQGGNGYTILILARSTGGGGAWRKLVGNADADNYIDLYQSTSNAWHQDGSGESLFYNSGISVGNDTLNMPDSNWRLYCATGSNSGTLTNPTQAFAIGNEPASNAYPWIGNIALVMMYNRVLSTSEISQIFNAIRGRYSI